MRVPACLAAHVEAVHGFVPRDKVFHRTGHGMPNVGLAVGRGRPFIKDIARVILAQSLALAENILLTPKFQDIFF